jgi:opacity protein-like surface antigen
MKRQVLKQLIPIVSVTLLTAVLPIKAVAQEQGEDYLATFGVFGSIGLGGYWGDESFSGNGASFGGSFAAFPLGLLGFEAGIDGGSHKREFSSGVSREGSTLHVFGDATVRFTTSRLQPYITGGVGWLKSSTSRFEPGFKRLDSEDDSLALNLAVGLLWFVSSRWSIRPEFRAVNSASDAVIQRYYRASLGVGYHFGGR